MVLFTYLVWHDHFISIWHTALSLFIEPSYKLLFYIHSPTKSNRIDFYASTIRTAQFKLPQSTSCVIINSDTLVLIAGCPLLTSSGLSSLIQLRHLQELELTNCPGVSRELFEYLREHLPRCLVIE